MIKETFKQAVQNVLSNKVRTFLTMLGIIIGVMAVIVIVGLGNGMTRSMRDSFSAMGTNTLSIQIWGYGSRTATVDDLYDLVKKNPELLSSISPQLDFSDNTPKVGTTTCRYSEMYGVDENYIEMKGYTLAKGRNIQYMDIADNKQICVIGDYINRTAYGGNAVGQTIKLGPYKFRIVGVLKAKISNPDQQEGSDDDSVYLPYTTAMRLSNESSPDSYSAIMVDEGQANEAKAAVEQGLYDIFKSDNAYYVYSASEWLEEMNKMIDGTLTDFDEGDLIDGTVVKIEHDEVLVDIGFKSEGVIPARELSIRKDADPSEVVSLGDKLEALVLQKEDKDGRLILSKKRAEYERAWIQVEEKFKAGEVVTGEVIEVVKGGLIIEIGIRGFLTAPLVDLRRVKDLTAYLGTEIEARVIEMDRNRNNVVLSRRVLLEEGRKNERAEILSKLVKGMRLKGTVSSIVDFGAFVEILPGVDGLLHISEMADYRVNKVTDICEEGQYVTVKVIDIDQSGKIRLSRIAQGLSAGSDIKYADQMTLSRAIEGRTEINY